MFWEGEAGLAQIFPGHSSPCGATRKSSRRENLRSAVSAGEPGEGDESRISSCRESIDLFQFLQSLVRSATSRAEGGNCFRVSLSRFAETFNPGCAGLFEG